MARFVVGVSSHTHDAACCILRDGRLVAAAQEERFSRVKHTPAMPVRAFGYCLDAAGASLESIDAVAYFESPSQKLERQLSMGLPALSVACADVHHRLDATSVSRQIREQFGYSREIVFCDHHRSHAASAYYLSGFESAAVLTVDGVGGWETTTYGFGDGARLERTGTVRFPHSLGLFYSAITAYLGFDVNDGEYKVMGLAPYGQPLFYDRLSAIVELRNDGQVRLDLSYFDFLGGRRMYSDKFEKLLGHPPRTPDAPIGQFHSNVARSAQMVLEDRLLGCVRYLRRSVPSMRLAVAGGVAHNCVGMSRIVRDGGFEAVFVQPAAGDAGACLGAAFLADAALGGQTAPCRLESVYLGPEYRCSEIIESLKHVQLAYRHYHDNDAALANEVAARLARGEVIGWFQGRMEFGPRALGARSILADPRGSDVRDRLNRLVKRRESFRPFAPAVLCERYGEWFEAGFEDPFMTLTCAATWPDRIPAATHVDGSARPQIVDRRVAPRFHRVIESFEALTGCPVLLNTSMNEKDEPIACTPTDALRVFVRCSLDALVLEDAIVEAGAVPPQWREYLTQWRPTPFRMPYNVYTLL
jgi:carbamoyltransferase